MRHRAITPLFQWWEQCCGGCSDRPAAGTQSEPAAQPGSHRGECWFLAAATALLAATAAVPATAGLRLLWLRIPAIVLLLFLLPQLVMALVALISPVWAGNQLSREASQDWSCLGVMTAWAAWRSTGGGWPSTICQGWLIFVGLNLLVFGVQWACRRSAGRGGDRHGDGDSGRKKNDG